MSARADLAAAALLIGLTGTWSPCGFSMVETIGPRATADGAATTLAACATFVPGALVGGVVTFGLLSALGELIHGAGGALAYLVAAGDRGRRRGRPRRAACGSSRRSAASCPSSWRRAMPMPLAALLYGVLLGLGFTTFVLSFGVWALAGISFALGRSGAGLVIGARLRGRPRDPSRGGRAAGRPPVRAGVPAS